MRRLTGPYTFFQSIDDLEKRVEMALLTSQLLGTCNYRCPGCDALNTLMSVTYEMGQKLGTNYRERVINYLKRLQKTMLLHSMDLDHLPLKGLRL